MITFMTNKERLTVLAIFISVLGFAFVSALKPVMISYVVKQHSNVTSYSFKDYKVELKTLHYISQDQSSKIVDMLSEVLEIAKEDIVLLLEGGTKPRELLLSSGILLSDLSEEYSFDIVGSDLIRFRV